MLSGAPKARSRSTERTLLAVVFACALSPTVADAKSSPVSAAATFADDICPQADPAGRYLNALGAGGSADGDTIVYAAERLVDAYHDCAFRYDRAYPSDGAPDPEDRAFTNRLYARLELALAFQRVGMIAEQLHEPDAARAQYDGALATIDDLEGLAARCPLPDASTAQQLVAQARDLRVAVAAVEAELKPAGTATAAPASE